MPQIEDMETNKLTAEQTTRRCEIRAMYADKLKTDISNPRVNWLTDKHFAAELAQQSKGDFAAAQLLGPQQWIAVVNEAGRR